MKKENNITTDAYFWKHHFIFGNFVFLQRLFISGTLKLMRIISRNRLIEFYQKNAEAEVALEDWYKKTKKASWECFADMKRTFNSADNVDNQRYVFNIHGNKYRLVALILFQIKTVYVRYIGSHSDYDKLSDIKSI